MYWQDKYDGEKESEKTVDEILCFLQTDNKLSVITQENQQVNPNQISNEEKDDKSANPSPDISDAMSVSTSDSSSSSNTSLDEYNHKKRQKFMSERPSPVDTRTVSLCPDNNHPVSNDEGVTQVPTSHDLNVSSPNVSHSLNFNLSNLDTDSSNWVDIGLNLQTPITARDLVTLENQSRGQSDVISLFVIHTDRNLIAHAFNIQRKCLATLAIENTLKGRSVITALPDIYLSACL